jgi:hypothetical protein
MNCGNQTALLKTELSSMRSLKSTWHKLRALSSANVPAAGFAIILGIIPIAVILWMYMSVISSDISTDIKMILNLVVKTTSISLFIPMLLIAFNPLVLSEEYRICLKDVLKALRLYPRYLGFSLISGLFFVIFYIVCFGLPSFGSDPILRLVWIVLVNYWIAIILPAPVLMEKLSVSPVKAILLSYKHFHDLRWNIYLLALVLTILNALAFSLLIFPLLITIPLSWYAIRDYTNKLLEFELLSYRV